MFSEVKKVLEEELFVDADIEPDSRLKEDLEIDSLAAFELSLQLEERYGIEISEEELHQLVVVEDIVKLLEKKGITV